MDNKQKIADDLEALSPEEVKAIGEIEIGPSKQDQFLNKHYKKLIVGGCALMVAISAGICIATFNQQHKDAGAAALTGVAVDPSSSASVTPAYYSANGLTAVQQEYDGTDSAVTASLMEGLSLLTSESTAEKGVAALEEAAATTENNLTRARALSAVAMHYMGLISQTDKESMKKAEEAWLKVAQLPVNPYTALAFVTLGDLAKSQGNTEGAKAYYAQMQVLCPRSAITTGELMDLRLQVLDTDEPEMVEPAPATPAPTTPGVTPSTPSIFDTAGTPFAPFSPTTPASPLTPTAPSTTPGLPTTPTIPGISGISTSLDTPAPAEEPAPAPAEEPAPVPAE